MLDSSTSIRRRKQEEEARSSYLWAYRLLSGAEGDSGRWRALNDFKMLGTEYDNNLTLTKWLESTYKLPFRLTGYEKYVHDHVFHGNQEVSVDRFMKFLVSESKLIKDVHNLYEDLNSSEEFRRKVEADREKIVNIIREQSAKIKTKPMGKDRLIHTIYPFIKGLIRSLTDDEMYEMYKRGRPNKKPVRQPVTFRDSANPWRSSRKVRDFAVRYGRDIDDAEVERESRRIPRFDKKKAKSFQLSFVAPRNSFVIDYFFSGQYTYLLAINVNTRKAYAIPSGGDGIRGSTGEEGDKKVKDKWTTIQNMEKLLSLTEVKNITHDEEPAFVSKEFRQWCLRNGINDRVYVKYSVGEDSSLGRSRANHSTLALIDRLSRTIRDMNYNIYGAGRESIPPKVMNYLISEYNDSVHDTLSRIAGKKVAPNDVNDDPELENEIAFRVLRNNALVTNSKDFQLSPGEKVLVANDTDPMEKKRGAWLSSPYTVIGRTNGLVNLKNDAGNYLSVPRWKLNRHLF